MQEQLGRNRREKRPQEERRLDAAGNGNSAGASKMLKVSSARMNIHHRHVPLEKQK
jgi:hypothetical protein